MKVLLLAFITIAAAWAQPAAPLEFDVASVRPNTLDDHIVTIDVGPGGRFAARGYTLKLLIQQAFEVKGFQISGGPAWLDQDRYDVEGRAPVNQANATRSQLNQMLQTLLVRRFGLKIHTIGKEMPGFELSVAGHAAKMTPSAATEENPLMTRGKDHALAAAGISMPSFTKVLGSYLSKPVKDATGLTGLFDFKVLWTERADQISDSEPEGISMISALRDQLGLKLASKREIAEILVIDDAAKATAN